MHNARDKNIGWRLDYFLVDNEIEKNISNSTIENQIFGSDHCPITLSLNDLY
jgi:exodeoxyribonuclease-3